MRWRCLWAAASLALPSPARGANLDWLTQHKQPNLHYGQLVLGPYYQFGEAYDSNIYLNPQDQPGGASVNGGVRGSWITTNDLGFEASLPWRHLHSLSAGYDFDAHTYAAQPQSNDTIDQKTHLDYAYADARGLGLKAGDAYENTTDQAFSELTQRTRRWMNLAHAGFAYDQPGGPLTAGADLSQRVDKYLDPVFARDLNRYTQIAALDFGYKIQPKTTLYTAYRRQIIHYTVHRALPDQDKNNKGDEGVVGLSGALTRKITGKAEAGMTYRSYDEPPISGATRRTRNFTGAADLLYRPSSLTDVKWSLYRRLEESISAINRFYISQGVLLDVRRRARRKITVGANLGLEIDKYPDLQPNGAGAPDTRRDDNYFAGALIQYDIQAWLSTGLSYSFRQRDSTFSGLFSFQDHVTSWNVAARF